MYPSVYSMFTFFQNWWEICGRKKIASLFRRMLMAFSGSVNCYFTNKTPGCIADSLKWWYFRIPESGEKSVDRNALRNTNKMRRLPLRHCFYWPTSEQRSLGLEASHCQSCNIYMKCLYNDRIRILVFMILYILKGLMTT